VPCKTVAKAQKLGMRQEVNLPTLGGRQFWADTRWALGWRIQRHCWTGHYRLLDASDRRHTFGSKTHCEEALLAELGDSWADAVPADTHFVVLLHGLGRSRHSFSEMKQALIAEGFTPIDVGYPSTRASVAEHALGVEGLLTQLGSDLPGQHPVSFVTHSLGGLIARRLLEGTPCDERWNGGFQVNRLVMMAPPSTGAALAESLQHQFWFRLLLGPSAQELPPEQAAVIPLPELPFGVIAGIRGDEKAEGWNPMLEGEDDGIVALAETRLPGMSDFLVVNSLHTFVMSEPKVLLAVPAFLRCGIFEPPKQKWWVYVLLSESSNSPFTYVGIALDVEKRLAQHNGLSPGGAKATRARRPWKVAATYGPYANRSEAQAAEAVVKKYKGLARLNCTQP